MFTKQKPFLTMTKARALEIQAEQAEALASIIGLPGIVIEICGAWAWISGDTRTHKEALKAAGCRWAPAKKLWYYRPEGWRAYKRGSESSMDDIRAKYGSSKPYAGRMRPSLGAPHA